MDASKNKRRLAYSADLKKLAKAKLANRTPSLLTPFSYFWLKDVIKQVITYKHFPDSLIISFAFLSIAIAFKAYPLLALVPILVIIFTLTLIHPLIGLIALLFFSYPPLIYQAPLLAWVFGMFVAASLFAGFLHYRTISFLFSMIMLPLSPIGAFLELPVFIIAILVLGFKRASIAMVVSFFVIAMFAGLTGLPVSAPIAYNSTAANSQIVKNTIAQYLIPSKPQPSIANFGRDIAASFQTFFSLNVTTQIFNGFGLAGRAIAFSFPILAIQLLVWIMVTFAVSNYAVKSRSAFKGTEASFFGIIIPVVYALSAYLGNAPANLAAAIVSFMITPILLFLLESQNIEVVQALNVMKQDILNKFGAEMGLVTPKETFNDVADYDNIKKELNEAVITPIEHREITGAYGVQPAKGILLFGPPGTGKTLIMRALANEIRAGFYYISAPSLISAYPGESTQMLTQIFETAKKHAPAVVFIDEIDAVGRKRSDEIVEPVREILTTLLTEMDGLQDLKNVVVLAATNRPEDIDPALLRPGRFDKIIEIPMPDAQARLEILKVHTRRMPLDKDVDLQELAAATENYTGAEIENVVREAGMYAIRAKRNVVKKEDFMHALEDIKPAIPKEVSERIKRFKEEPNSMYR